MNRIGADLLRERKDAVLGVSSSFETKANTEEYEINGRDLLTALVNSNMDTEIPVSQRMADKDVLARESGSSNRWLICTQMILAEVPTFLIAGHETTR